VTNSMREKSITLAVAVLICLALGLALIKPRTHALGALREQIGDKNSKNSKLFSEYEQLVEQSGNIDILKAQLKQISKRLPQEINLTIYENFLTKLAAKHGIFDLDRRNYDVRFRAPQVFGNITTARVTITFVSDSMTFYQYLKELESQPELTEIESLAVIPQAQEGSDQFEVILNIKIYYGTL